PGPIAPTGEILAAPTLWPGVPIEPFTLGARLERAWPGLRVRVLNDVTAVGLAYVAGGRESFCVVTVSSGIGHKVFLDGRPVTGPSGRGGEIGHVVVDPRPEAPECDCGGRGHLG